MNALQFTAHSQSVNLVKTAIPQIECSNEVLVKVSFCGLCNRDLRVIKGDLPCEAPQLILGHEFDGIIVDVGEEVTVFQVGDEVIVDPYIGCNGCFYCRDGRPHFCENRTEHIIGTVRNGAMAEYVICLQEQVYKKPQVLTFEQAVLIEPLSCVCHAYNSAIKTAKIAKKILIQGAGLTGILFACLLHQTGQQKVTILESNPNRLEILKKLDLGYRIETIEQMKCRNCSFDYIIDCTGSPQVVEETFPLLGAGGTLVLLGIYPLDMQLQVSPYEIYEKEIEILGVYTNPFSFPNAIGVAAAMGERYLNYELLGIKTYTFKNYGKALEDIEAKKITKAVFNVSTSCTCN